MTCLLNWEQRTGKPKGLKIKDVAISPVEFPGNWRQESNPLKAGSDATTCSMAIISKFGIGVLIAMVSEATAQQTVWGQCELTYLCQLVTKRIGF